MLWRQNCVFTYYIKSIKPSSCNKSARLAQSVEHETLNLRVVGSSPTLGAQTFYLYFIFFQVLFRMNFLAVLLCLAMNRPYQFYYFVPLVSFWFTMQYAMMACPPQVKKSFS